SLDPPLLRLGGVHDLRCRYVDRIHPDADELGDAITHLISDLPAHLPKGVRPGDRDLDVDPGPPPGDRRVCLGVAAAQDLIQAGPGLGHALDLTGSEPGNTL